MRIQKENENYSITGYFNKQEVEFISSYFLNFGETIISIQPVMLKELIYNKVLSIKQTFNFFKIKLVLVIFDMKKPLRFKYPKGFW